jgi:hypothetical protein
MQPSSFVLPSLLYGSALGHLVLHGQPEAFLRFPSAVT